MRRKTDPEETPILPFPTSPVSNGEYEPLPITRTHVLAAQLIAEETEKRARRHGITRAEFLRTAAATATAFMVLNKIHGLDAWGDDAVLPVTETHCEDLDAACELLDQQMFVMDVQMHHVDTERFPGTANCFLRFLGQRECRQNPEILGRLNFVKEVFLDSQTTVGVISGLPSGTPQGPDSAAATRDLVNELAGSQRCLAQAMIDPAVPANAPTGLESLEYQVKVLKGVAIKGYTYNGRSVFNGQPLPGWRLDDENVSYPMIEQAQRLGIRLINVHKGLPAAFAPGSAETVRTIDFPTVVRDWPKMRFCAYHSGYFEAGYHPEGLDAGFHPEGEPVTPGRYGIEEFIRMIESMRKDERKRVYAEIGSTFGFLLLSQNGPGQVAHLIGRLLKALGSTNILWGTDSIWWGSPQFLIDAFKRLQIPVSMQERYGYPPLTKEMKRRILGLNAAALYGVNPQEARNRVPSNALDQLQLAQGGFRAGRSLRTYGPRNRREFLSLRWREERAEALRTSRAKG